VISFFVPGRPRSTQTGSVVRVKGRAIPLRMNTPWSAYVGLIARQHAPQMPLDGPLALTLEFSRLRPKHGRHVCPVTRPDLENLSKGLLDALQGILYHDDAQIVELGLRKVYGLREGVNVTCSEMAP